MCARSRPAGGRPSRPDRAHASVPDPQPTADNAASGRLDMHRACAALRPERGQPAPLGADVVVHKRSALECGRRLVRRTGRRGTGGSTTSHGTGGKAEPGRSCQVGAPLRMLYLAFRRHRRLTLLASASACNTPRSRSSVRRPRSRAAPAGLDAGASRLNRRSMKMSLGTPAADSPPPVDAPPPIEANMAGHPQTRPHLPGLPLPHAPLASLGRQWRKRPVQTAERPWAGAGTTVARRDAGLTRAGHRSDDTPALVTHPSRLADEQLSDRPVADAPHAVHHDIRAQRPPFQRLIDQ